MRKLSSIFNAVADLKILSHWDYFATKNKEGMLFSIRGGGDLLLAKTHDKTKKISILDHYRINKCSKKKTQLFIALYKIR